MLPGPRERLRAAGSAAAVADSNCAVARIRNDGLWHSFIWSTCRNLPKCDGPARLRECKVEKKSRDCCRETLRRNGVPSSSYSGVESCRRLWNGLLEFLFVGI